MDAEGAGTGLEKGDDLRVLGERSFFLVLSKQGGVSIQNWDCLHRPQFVIKTRVVAEMFSLLAVTSKEQPEIPGNSGRPSFTFAFLCRLFVHSRGKCLQD